ncbi:CCA tRNA nucleotidyltransferase [Amaricoccus tamworthensis]|uniref:CCA tRNA nucleotidyltransferase n=1 Tax=Amaricoccus tamworthensis TaxID=57002 RepID=UPI003C7CE666
MTRVEGSWLTDPSTRRVCDAFSAAGARVLFVGGCVRNSLMGRPVTDVDMATDEVPERVMEIVSAAGLRAVPTGLDHGTVTVVSDGTGFEVTTFRRDEETTGRHARVAWSADLNEDAARRDFTMNALYATPDGEVLDPLGGMNDLRAGLVRFVGDADRRIAEDYLRILRFFRFYAWYGNPEGGLDADGLSACAAGTDGLAQLSRERVGAEISRLLAAADPGQAVAAMSTSGVLNAVLPGSLARFLPVLVEHERALGVEPRWLRRLAVLGQSPDWTDALRMSKADRRAFGAIGKALDAMYPPAVSGYYFGRDTALDAALIQGASLEMPLAPDLIAEIDRGASAKFPVRAADLDETGAALGEALRLLEAKWVSSDFHATKAQLLSE